MRHGVGVTTPPTPADDRFAEVRRVLSHLLHLTSAPQVDLLALGKSYAELSRALLTVVQNLGKTSMRFEAAVKALDLRTPKSALQQFLNKP